MYPGRNLKSSGGAMSRCYSRKPLGYPSGPPRCARDWSRKESRRKGSVWKGEKEDCSFSELERKFAQLSGTRCLPLVPLIVVESTTGAESKNKGNTSRVLYHHHYRHRYHRLLPSSFVLLVPSPLPLSLSPYFYLLLSRTRGMLESISPRSRHLFSLPRFYW